MRALSGAYLGGSLEVVASPLAPGQRLGQVALLGACCLCPWAPPPQLPLAVVPGRWELRSRRSGRGQCVEPPWPCLCLGAEGYVAGSEEPRGAS